MLKTLISEQRQKNQKEADQKKKHLLKKRILQQKENMKRLDKIQNELVNLENEICCLQERKLNLLLKLKRLYEKEYRKQRFSQHIYSEMTTGSSAIGYSANSEITHPQLSSSTMQNACLLSNVDESQVLKTGSSKSTFSRPSIFNQSITSIPSTSYISHHKSPSYVSSYKPILPPKLKETTRLPSDTREISKKSEKITLSRWLDYALRSNKSYSDYCSITPFEEIPEPPELACPSGALSLTTHQPAYATNMHAMEQHKGTYDEGKQGMKGETNTFQPSSVTSYQSPPNAPATDDVSYITLSRILCYNKKMFKTSNSRV